MANLICFSCKPVTRSHVLIVTMSPSQVSVYLCLAFRTNLLKSHVVYFFAWQCSPALTGRLVYTIHNVRVYTVSQKRHYTLVQILTDFHNSFTDVLSWKFAIKLLLKIPPITSDVLLHYLKCSNNFNKTVHRRTGHARQSSYCNGRHPHSSHLICGLRIVQISTQ